MPQRVIASHIQVFSEFSRVFHENTGQFSVFSFREKLLTLFQFHLRRKSEELDTNFVFPDYFQDYLILLKNRHFSFGDPYGYYLLSPDAIILDTKCFLESKHVRVPVGKGNSLCGKARQQEQYREYDEIWIEIGGRGDKHWFFLCCDKASRNYGKVMDGYDNTPWHCYEHLEKIADTFLMFLSYSIKYAKIRQE